MPITTTDYVLTDTWIYNGIVPCLNVYYYRSTGGNPTAEDLIDAFRTIGHPILAASMTDVMASNLIEAKNLVVTTDFDQQVPSAVGTVPADTLPPFNALFYRINRSDLAFRNSGKRYAGVPETWQSDGVLSGVGVAERDAVRDFLFNTLNGVSATYRLMIPRRVKTVNPNPPPDFTYVLTDLGVPASVNLPRLTTQNSRKSSG